MNINKEIQMTIVEKLGPLQLIAIDQLIHADENCSIANFLNLKHYSFKVKDLDAKYPLTVLPISALVSETKIRYKKKENEEEVVIEGKFMDLVREIMLERICNDSQICTADKKMVLKDLAILETITFLYEDTKKRLEKK